jgi:hypothetical protein
MLSRQDAFAQQQPVRSTGLSSRLYGAAGTRALFSHLPVFFCSISSEAQERHAAGLKHPLIFYFGLLGECFDRRDSRAFTAFVPEKLLVFQSSNNIKSYNHVTRGVLSY